MAISCLHLCSQFSFLLISIYYLMFRASICLETGEKLCEIGSLLPLLCGFWGLNSGHNSSYLLSDSAGPLCVCMNAMPIEARQNRVLDPLVLELQGAISCQRGPQQRSSLNPEPSRKAPAFTEWSYISRGAKVGNGASRCRGQGLGPFLLDYM